MNTIANSPKNPIPDELLDDELIVEPSPYLIPLLTSQNLNY